MEIYRQFLFGDDDRTYSKCEGDVEDDGGGVNGDGNDEGNNGNDEDGDGKNVSNSTASVEEGARTGEAATVPNYENMQRAEKQQQKQPN